MLNNKLEGQKKKKKKEDGGKIKWVLWVHLELKKLIIRTAYKLALFHILDIFLDIMQLFKTFYNFKDNISLCLGFLFWEIRSLE